MEKPPLTPPNKCRATLPHFQKRAVAVTGETQKSCDIKSDDVQLFLLGISQFFSESFTIFTSPSADPFPFVYRR